jgi:predicted negative regulator of RcsB-dependent stress response
MSNTEDPSSLHTKIFAGLAAFLAILLSLVWTIDDSIVYLLSGLIALCVFFAFYYRPAREKVEFKKTTYSNQTYQEEPVWKEMLKAFQKKKTPDVNVGSPKAQNPKIILVIAGSFIIFLGIIIVVVTFTTDDTFGDASLYSDTGDYFYNNGKYDSAYLQYKYALDIDPNFENALLGVGNIKLNEKDYDSALFYYSNILVRNKNSSGARYGKALVYYNQKRYPETIKEIQSILKNDTSYVDAYLLAGDTYYVQQRYDSALWYYEPAYQRNVRSRDLCYIMAYIYDQKGKSTEAVALYKETLTYDSTITDIYRRLGELIPGEEGNTYRVKGL